MTSRQLTRSSPLEEVRDDDAAVVASSTFDSLSVDTNVTVVASMTWDTTGASPGTYTVVATADASAHPGAQAPASATPTLFADEQSEAAGDDVLLDGEVRTEGPWSRATVTITVTNDPDGSAASGVSVEGEWYLGDSAAGTSSWVTGTSGTCTAKARERSSSAKWRFTVTEVDGKSVVDGPTWPDGD